MTVRDLIQQLLDYPLDTKVSMRVIATEWLTLDNEAGISIDADVINVFPLYSKEGLVGVGVTNDPDED